MIQQARAEVVAQPILPPRPTGRSFAAAKAERSTWKSWPMLVIVLASIAIIVAVVLMVWPASSDAAAGKRSLQPPPAPERMETNPLPPPGQGNNNGADPWGGHSQIDPDQTDPVPGHGGAQPRHTPDPIPQAPVAPQDPDDPFSGMGQLGQLGGMGNTNVMVAMMAHACDKLKACPSGADDDMLTNVCDSFSMFAQRSAPPTCDAAKRCFDAIDKMDCSSSGFASPVTAVTSLQDCTRAMTSC